MDGYKNKIYPCKMDDNGTVNNQVYLQLDTRPNYVSRDI